MTTSHSVRSRARKRRRASESDICSFGWRTIVLPRVRAPVERLAYLYEVESYLVRRREGDCSEGCRRAAIDSMLFRILIAQLRVFDPDLSGRDPLPTEHERVEQVAAAHAKLRGLGLEYAAGAQAFSTLPHLTARLNELSRSAPDRAREFEACLSRLTPHAPQEHFGALL